MLIADKNPSLPPTLSRPCFICPTVHPCESDHNHGALALSIAWLTLMPPCPRMPVHARGLRALLLSGRPSVRRRRRPSVTHFHPSRVPSSLPSPPMPASQRPPSIHSFIHLVRHEGESGKYISSPRNRLVLTSSVYHTRSALSYFVIKLVNNFAAPKPNQTRRKC